MATAGRWLHVALASGRFIARLDPVADSTPTRLRLDSALVSDSTPTPTRLRLDSDSIPTPTRDSDPDPTQGPTRLRFRFELVSDSTPTPTSIRLRPDSAPDSTPTRLRLRLLRRDGGGGDPDEDDHDGVGRHPLRRLGFRRPRLANPFLLSLNPTLLLPSAPAFRVRFGSSQLRLSNSPWRASLALRPRAGVRHGLAAARRRRSGRPAAWSAPRSFAPSSRCPGPGRRDPRRSAPEAGQEGGGGGRGGSSLPAAAERRCGRGGSRPPAAAECRCCARRCQGPEQQRPTQACPSARHQRRCKTRRRQSQGRHYSSARGPDERPQRQAREEEGLLHPCCSFSFLAPLSPSCPEG